MLDVDVARRWSSDAQLPTSLGQWRWFREAVPPLLQASAVSAGIANPGTVDMYALGKSFWAWAAALDSDRGFAQLDPVDFAHFMSGQLLHQWVVHRPLVVPATERSRECLSLTRSALTLLAAWRMAIGKPMLQMKFEGELPPQWTGFVENTAEDASSAVAFLDLFTGLEPVWLAPLRIAERPAVQRALVQRVQSHASGVAQDLAPTPGH